MLSHDGGEEKDYRRAVRYDNPSIPCLEVNRDAINSSIVTLPAPEVTSRHRSFQAVSYIGSWLTKEGVLPRK